MKPALDKNLLVNAYLEGVRDAINMLKKGVLEGLSFSDSLAALENSLCKTKSEVDL